MSTFRIRGPESSESSEIEFGAVLSGVEYLFSLQWNEAAEFWAITITDTRRQEVLSGIRVVAGTDMLEPYNEMPRLPPGRLVAFDTSNKFADPGRDDWRERHILVYEEPVEPVEENFIRVTPPAPPPPMPV